MKKKFKLFCIGNSFSLSLDRYLPGLAAEAGCDLLLAHAYRGGCELWRHWEYITNEEKDGQYSLYHFPDGRPAKLRELLTMAKWDVVTMQQASHESWRPETFHPWADQIRDYVKKHAPQAEIRIQQTWAYRSDDGRIRPGGEWGISQEEMHNRLTKNYKDLAKAFHAKIIPTGEAVRLARKAEKNPFVPYPEESLASCRWPDLPSQAGDVVGQMNWKKSDDGTLSIRRDTIHLNCRGQYLQACVWAAALLDAEEKDLTFVPEELSDKDAANLRKIALKAVRTFNKRGNFKSIGKTGEKRIRFER